MRLVRISPSPPDFKGLLKNSNPFFIGGTLTIGDLIGDCLKNVRRFPVHFQIMQIDSRGPGVQVSKYLLCSLRVFEVGGYEVP